MLPLEQRRAADGASSSASTASSDRHDRDQQRRHEQPVAEAQRRRQALRLRRFVDVLAAHARREQRQRDHRRIPRARGQLVAGFAACQHRSPATNSSASSPQNARHRAKRRSRRLRSAESSRNSAEQPVDCSMRQHRRASVASRRAARASSARCEATRCASRGSRTRRSRSECPTARSAAARARCRARRRSPGSAAPRRTRGTRPRRRTGRRCRSPRPVPMHLLRVLARDRPVRLRAARFGHRRQQRPHRLRVAGDVGQADHAGQLAHAEVGDQQARQRQRRASAPIQRCACSRRPSRSSRPITGSVSSEHQRGRGSAEALAEQREQLEQRLPASSPLTSPALTTTSTGLSRSAKPSTTTATPISGH